MIKYSEYRHDLARRIITKLTTEKFAGVSQNACANAIGIRESTLAKARDMKPVSPAVIEKIEAWLMTRTH